MAEMARLEMSQALGSGDPVQIDLSALHGGISHPELFFGVVSAVGTPSKSVEIDLTTELKAQGYDVKTIRLSDLLRAFTLATPSPGAAEGEYDRIKKLMKRGDEL